MTAELEVLEIVSRRLEAARFAYMLTGSYALAYYATPRMTRDLDLVVALSEPDVDTLVASFSPDFYVDPDAVREAIKTEHMFNLMHFASGMKVDFILRKSSEYRQMEFSRRKRVTMNNLDTWIVSREDLLLSKLVWAKSSGSEQQRRDARQLLEGTVDMHYLDEWAIKLDVGDLIEELRDE